MAQWTAPTLMISGVGRLLDDRPIQLSDRKDSEPSQFNGYETYVSQSSSLFPLDRLANCLVPARQVYPTHVPFLCRGWEWNVCRVISYLPNCSATAGTFSKVGGCSSKSSRFNANGMAIWDLVDEKPDQERATSAAVALAGRVLFQHAAPKVRLKWPHEVLNGEGHRPRLQNAT